MQRIAVTEVAGHQCVGVERFTRINGRAIGDGDDRLRALGLVITMGIVLTGVEDPGSVVLPAGVTGIAKYRCYQ